MSGQDVIEQAAQRIGAQTLGRIEAARPADYTERLRRDPLVRWAERGSAFLARVFQFIDVYPAIAGDEALLEHLTAYLGDPQAFLPEEGLPSGRLADAVRRVVEALKDRFVAGETVDEALAVCRDLHDRGFAFTLDILGEAVISEWEAERYLQAYLDLIPRVAAVVAGWPARPQIEESPYGPVPRLNLSIKLTSLYHRFEGIDPQGSFDGVAPGTRAIFRAAREHGASINVDMEQFDVKDLTLEVFKQVLTEDEFRDWPHASITIQTYLKESRDDLAAMIDWAKRRGTPIQVRLVKGAYWDWEVQAAAYRNWPTPVFTAKEGTDANFEAAVRTLLENHEYVHPITAGHNVRSGAYAMAVAKSLGLPRNAVEHQTLLGLGEELSLVLMETGHRHRVYVPFGRLTPGMAYLVRRLLEATAETAFLQRLWQTPLQVDDLLKPPAGIGPSTSEVLKTSDVWEPNNVDSPFRNEPLTDFAKRDAHDAMSRALDDVRGRLGQSYPLRIGGKAVEAAEEIVSLNPGRKTEVVGRVARASRRQALSAVRAARRAFPKWSATPARERAALFLRAAEIMRRRRYELAAWEVFEEAKSWREADGDVAEAIDYLEFYAREAVRIARQRERNVHGEDNAYFYEPRGVAVAITPWNFPLAILTGVTVAAAAAGNAVIMKPAEQSSVVAAKFQDLLNEAGLPPGVVQYVSGLGEEVGEYLVRHPDVNVIAFTGSAAVGLRIERLAARTSPKQAHVKRVVAEMGGKNAIIVDRDADLDQAIPGVVASAFGYQGQKCSACSRVIVHREVYDPFLERLVAAARSLPIGPAWDPHSAVGPLIDEDAFNKVRKYIEVGRETARTAFQADVSALEGEGYYVGPTVFADVDPEAVIAQEEIFGPVLCVIHADDFDQALAIANGTPYGLTGGLYSRNRRHIERARREFHVGNLYVNRKITGALVDRQPFGGIRLSGIGSKAGGPDYLLQFMQPKAFCEYTVRRGFAPPVDREKDTD